MTPVLSKLFTDTGDTVTMRTYHTGLLWGLEAIAWAPEYFPQAAEALIRLAEIDPGGRLANRPSNSFVSLFRPWFPQTSAPLQSRLTVLRGVVSRHPEASQSLLLGLLPERMGAATANHVPRFRDWGGPPKSVSAQDFWEFVHGVVVLLLEQVGPQPQLWALFVEHLPDLDPPLRSDVYERLGRFANDAEVSSETKEQVWSVLGDMVRQHRAFADAHWALPAADIAKIEELAEQLKPVDPVEQSRWLFDSQVPQTGSSRSDDFAAYDREVERLRETAIRGIVSSLGLEGIHRLVESAAESMIIGRTIANAWADAPEVALLQDLDSADRKRSRAAMGYAIRRTDQAGLPWIDEILPRFVERPVAQARILLASRSFSEVWNRLEVLSDEVEQSYWAEFLPYGIGDDPVLIGNIAMRLMEHGRPGAAADLLHLYVGRTNPAINPELVAVALTAAVDDQSPELMHLANYGIQLLLDYLRSSNYDEERLAVLEWRVFPALGYGAQSPVLERRLARDPQFFVQILSIVYRRRDGTSADPTQPEAAQNAFHLLHEWQVVPGSNARGGPIDEGALKKWINDARRLLREADREDIGLQTIGQVFAYAAEDADGTWPSLPVRNVIDSFASDELDQGFMNGTYNKRGTTSRGLTDGGRQEFELADQFESWSHAIANERPRTSALLRSISEGYRMQGRREDEEVRRFLEGLDR
jgi:hypothetical protein